MLAEIHADHAAFTSLVKSLVITGHCIFNDDNKTPIDRIYESVISGICLLFSCFFSIVNCSKGIDFYGKKPGELDHSAIFDGSHLPEPDRLALMFAAASEVTDTEDTTLKDAFEGGLTRSTVNAFKFVSEVVRPNVPEAYAAWQMIAYYGRYDDRAKELLDSIRASSFFAEFADACKASTFGENEIS